MEGLEVKEEKGTMEVTDKEAVAKEGVKMVVLKVVFEVDRMVAVVLKVGMEAGMGAGKEEGGKEEDGIPDRPSHG